ncbi:CBS domain-containing protein [Streptomyces sp. NPDC001339]|uniref:CBS domain-containing protein n=1 Tax=Streptomyces sp. NPDC001339 TaxID=3364563 RepID=UPI0036A804C7
MAMEIKYAMSSPPASVPPDASLEEAARHMADAGVGALPVVQGEEVIGMVTDRDLVVRAMAHGLSPQLKVETVMSADPVTVDAGTPVTVALHAMQSIKIRHLPVVDHKRLVGMVSFDDLFSYLSVQLGALADVVDASRRVPGSFPTR